MEKRKELIETLVRNFWKDLNESIKPISNIDDRIYFITALSEFLSGIYNEIPENEYIEAFYFDEEKFIREKLLAKFRDKMAPFVSTNLRYYFAKDEIKQRLIFHKLKIEQPVLNYNEYDEYIHRINFLLNRIIEQLYLKPTEPINNNSEESLTLIEESGKEEEFISGDYKSKSKDYTRTRQTLLYYYVLKLMGITKLDASARKLSQFAHVLFAYPTDDIDNSPIYRNFKKAPYLKEKKGLLIDLGYIKKQFELIEHEPGITLVQKEIDFLNRK